MLYCPIRIGKDLYPKEIALITAERSYTYEALDRLIDAYQPKAQIFYAHPTLETILQIFSLARRGKAAMPVSPRLPNLPSLELPAFPYLCLQTSGSTGAPKIALLTYENFYYSALGSPALPSVGDSSLASLPFNHVGGLAPLFRTFLGGATLLLPGGARKVTHASFVPTQLKRYLDKPIYPDLKALLIGGAPISYDLALRGHLAGLPLYLTYGMTEMTSQIATKRFDPADGVIFGQALPFREINFTQEKEILVRGKTLFSGYIQVNSESTWVYLGGSPHDRWFATKDLGEWTPKGLRWIGRKDRMRVSGGENIYPEEIEAALTAMPEIERYFVSFREDEEFGYRPLAFIEFKTPLPFQLLREKLAITLPSYKIPSLSDLHPLEALQKDSGIPGAKEFFQRSFSK